MYDGEGNFIDSHHIILLLIHYLVKYKGMTGKVCTAFSTTPKVEKLCKHYGLTLETVKIGFKYICEIMVREDVLIGGGRAVESPSKVISRSAMESGWDW